MRTVGLKTLENKLSEYIRLAASAETVLVTDRDRVVAQTTAPDAGTSPLLADATLADAVRRGWLRPPVVSFRGPPPAPPPVARLSEVLRELDRDHGDR